MVLYNVRLPCSFRTFFRPLMTGNEDKAERDNSNKAVPSFKVHFLWRRTLGQVTVFSRTWESAGSREDTTGRKNFEVSFGKIFVRVEILWNWKSCNWWLNWVCCWFEISSDVNWKKKFKKGKNTPSNSKFWK